MTAAGSLVGNAKLAYLLDRLIIVAKEPCHNGAKPLESIPEIAAICNEIEAHLSRDLESNGGSERHRLFCQVRSTLETAMLHVRAHMMAIDMTVRAYRRGAAAASGVMLGYRRDGRNAISHTHANSYAIA